MQSQSHPRQLAAFMSGAIVALSIAGAASGAPTNAANAAAITLRCANGDTPGVITLVRGEFTPVHLAGSNAIFIPVAFGEFTGSATDDNGNTLFTVDEPPLAKGNAAPANGRIEQCTGVIELDVPDGHFSGSSTVTGFFAQQ